MSINDLKNSLEELSRKYASDGLDEWVKAYREIVDMGYAASGTAPEVVELRVECRRLRDLLEEAMSDMKIVSGSKDACEICAYDSMMREECENCKTCENKCPCKDCEAENHFKWRGTK